MCHRRLPRINNTTPGRVVAKASSFEVSVPRQHFATVPPVLFWIFALRHSASGPLLDFRPSPQCPSHISDFVRSFGSTTGPCYDSTPLQAGPWKHDYAIRKYDSTPLQTHFPIQLHYRPFAGPCGCRDTSLQCAVVLTLTCCRAATMRRLVTVDSSCIPSIQSRSGPRVNGPRGSGDPAIAGCGSTVPLTSI